MRTLIVLVNFLVNNLTRPPGIIDSRWTARLASQHELDQLIAVG